MAAKLTGKKAGKVVKAKAKPKKAKKAIKKVVPKKATPVETKPEPVEEDMNGDVLEEEDFFGDDDQDHSIYTEVEGDELDE